MSNIAPIIVASAAAAARQAEDRVTRRLLAENALARTGAIVFAPEGAEEARALVRLLDRGVLHHAGAGRYWIDQAALRSPLGGRRRIVLLAIIAALALLGGMLLLWLERT